MIYILIILLLASVSSHPQDLLLFAPDTVLKPYRKPAI